MRRITFVLLVTFCITILSSSCSIEDEPLVVQETTPDQVHSLQPPSHSSDSSLENTTVQAGNDASALYTYNQDWFSAPSEDEPVPTTTKSESEYSNPIDEYFLPRIASASSEAACREYQDTYRGVWRSEFRNIVKWAASKYTYQQDIVALGDYVGSVEQLIANAQTLVIAELWVSEPDTPPDARESDPLGTGTRSWLNQLEGEIYRDAGMRLIRNLSLHDDYIFLDVDYSNEHYE